MPYNQNSLDSLRQRLIPDFKPEPEQDPVSGFGQEFMENIKKSSEFYAKEDEVWREHIRNVLLKDLTASGAGTRMIAQNFAENNVPKKYLPMLREEVAKASTAKEAIENKERSQQGYYDRFQGGIDEALRAGGRGMAGQVGAAIGAKNLATFNAPTKDQIEIKRGLENAALENNPEGARIDSGGIIGSAARGSQSVALGMAETIPDMYAGVKARQALGAAGGIGYWTARGVSGNRDDFVEMGVSPGWAALLGGATAGASGAIEQAIPDPFGAIKSTGTGSAVMRKATSYLRKTIVKLAKGKGRTAIKKAAGAIAGTTIRTLGEVGEETIDAAFQETIKFAVAKADPDIDDRDALDIAKNAWMAMKQSGPILLGLSGSGGIMQFQQSMNNFNRKVAGQKQGAMKTEVMQFANSGKTPTRKKWAEWGGLDTEGHSMKTRKMGVKAIAERLQREARERTVIEGHTPTEEQWKDWGFDPEKGKTHEDRKEHLFARFRPGFAREQEIKAGTQQAEESMVARDDTVALQVEASRALRESPGVIPPVEAAEVTEGLPGLRVGPQTPAKAIAEVDPARLGVAEQEGATRFEVSESPLVVPPQPESGLPTRFGKGKSLAEQASVAPTQAEMAQAAQLGVSPEAVATKKGKRGAERARYVPASKTAPPPKVTAQQAVANVDVRREVSPEIDPNSVEKISDDGFLKDTKGRIGIPVEKIMKKLRGLKTEAGMWARRLGKSHKGLGIEVHDINRRRMGKIGTAEAELAFTMRKYDTAAGKAFGGILNVNGSKMVDAVLHNEMDVEILPDVMREAVVNMRTAIDTLSNRLVDEGIVDGDLAIVISNNLRSYVTRSYRAFDDPKWAKKVPEKIRNEAVAWIRRESVDLSQEEAEGRIDNLLSNATKAGSSMGLLIKSQLGAKDLSAFRNRNEALPSQIRALLGEYKDPRVNYARSMMKISHVIANHEFLKEVAEIGEGRFLAPAGSPINGTEFGDLNVTISGEDSESMGPLAGMHTTKELASALKRALEPGQVSPLLRAYFKANGLVKAGKTIGSPMTQTRNFFGNIGFAVMQGHWRAGMLPKAWRITVANFRKKGSPEQEAYIKRLSELLVLGQDVRGGELRSSLKEALASNDIEDFLYNAEARRAHKVKTGIVKGAKVAADLYKAGDDFWKVYAFENEMSRYRKAMPNLSEIELEELCAKIVTDTYPTYSLVPEGAQMIRRFPGTGMFPSFPAEIIRTTYKTIELANKEMRDPATRSIGASRIAGMISVLTVPAAAAIFSRLWVGVSKEDDERMRQFRMDHEQNHQFIYTGKKGDVVSSLNASYSDPYTSLRSVGIAILRADNPIDGVVDAVSELISPFVSIELVPQTAVEIVSSVVDGRPGAVWKEGDTGMERLYKGMAHAVKNFQPGITSQGTKMLKAFKGTVEPSGRVHDPMKQGLGIAFGAKSTDMDVYKAVDWKLGKFRRAKSDAASEFTHILKSRGSVSAEQIRKAYAYVVAKRKIAYADAGNAVNDSAIITGRPMKDYRAKMAAAKISVIDRSAIVAGIPPTYVLSAGIKGLMKKANPDEFEARIAAFRDAVNEGRLDQPETK